MMAGAPAAATAGTGMTILSVVVAFLGGSPQFAAVLFGRRRRQRQRCHRLGVSTSIVSSFVKRHWNGQFHPGGRPRCCWFFAAWCRRIVVVVALVAVTFAVSRSFLFVELLKRRRTRGRQMLWPLQGSLEGGRRRWLSGGGSNVVVVVVLDGWWMLLFEFLCWRTTSRGKMSQIGSLIKAQCQRYVWPLSTHVDDDDDAK